MSEITQINEDTWRIEGNGVRFFLLTGTETAQLICGAKQILSGQAEGKEVNMFGKSVMLYQFEFAA